MSSVWVLQRTLTYLTFVVVGESVPYAVLATLTGVGLE